MARVISAWQELRPTKSFAGLTLEQFKTQVAPSVTTRDALRALQALVAQSRQQRRHGDEASNALMRLVVNAVKGDPAEGENGELYVAMGYVPENQRRSGLTRKGSTTSPAGTTAPL